MPYRLTYTGAAYPTGTTAPGHWAAERRELIPPSLAGRLAELIHPVYPAAEIPGASYRYLPAEVAGGIYHILCATHPAEGHSCSTHCLIFSQDEVQELCARETPPTPAGVMLALEQHKLWAPGAAPLPAELVPPATSAWLRLTGKSENAAALHIPPYRQGCILLLPRGTASTEALELLHESQVLSPTLGWGIPFRTSAADAEALNPQSYEFTTSGSARHRLAGSASCPILELLPSLDLMPESAAPAPEQPPRRPYIYCECRDHDTFPHPHDDMRGNTTHT